MRIVAAMCSEPCPDTTVLFETLDTDLPAGLLPSPSLVRVVRAAALISTLCCRCSFATFISSFRFILKINLKMFHKWREKHNFVCCHCVLFNWSLSRDWCCKQNIWTPRRFLFHSGSLWSLPSFVSVVHNCLFWVCAPSGNRPESLDIHPSFSDRCLPISFTLLGSHCDRLL